MILASCRFFFGSTSRIYFFEVEKKIETRKSNIFLTVKYNHKTLIFSVNKRVTAGFIFHLLVSAFFNIKYKL